jgi:hypothetical protein
MSLAIDWKAAEAALWNGLAQLIVLAIVGFVANIVIRRFKEVSTARQELLDQIDQFSIHLYKPRKIYQVMIDRRADLLCEISNPGEREACRLAAIHQALYELVDATGRLRTFQVKIIQLYGYNIDLLAHYLAIWRYMKEVRRRMEKGESLYTRSEKPESGDAFYRLFDSFRYRVSVARYTWRRPSLVHPPAELLAEMRKAGDAVYAEYFGPVEKPNDSFPAIGVQPPALQS